ncbi:MAG: hypothetical protein ACI9DK_001530 [Vicingaceae bacterium]
MKKIQMKKYITYFFLPVCILVATFSLAAKANDIDDKKPPKSTTDIPKDNDIKITGSKTLQSLNNPLRKVSVAIEKGNYTTFHNHKTISVVALNSEAEIAKKVFDDLESNNKIVANISPAALQSLPIAFPMAGSTNALLAINKATYYPTHIELEVYLRLYIGDKEFYFGNEKVAYVAGTGFAGNASLALLGTQEFSNNNYKLSLAGGSLTSNPTSTISQVKINCGVFDGLSLKGNFELNSEQYTALNNKGYEIAGKVSSIIDFETKELDKINLKVNDLTPFAIKQSSTKIGFIISEAEIDLSEKNSISSSEAFIRQSVPNNTSPSALKQWTGFYAEELSIFIPTQYVSTNAKDLREDVEKERQRVKASDLVIDASGLYFALKRTNPIAKTELMGIGFQLTLLDIIISKSAFEKFDTEGLLNNPFTLSSAIAQTDIIPINNKDEKGEYKITGAMSGSDTPSFGMRSEATFLLFFGGKTSPAPNSEFEMETARKPGAITPLFRLYGKLNVGMNKGKEGLAINTGEVDSDFSGLILEYENVTLRWFNKAPQFDFDKIALLAAGKLQNLPVGINSIIATYDRAKKIMELKLDSYIGLSALSPKLPRVEGVMTFNWNYGYDNHGNRVSSFRNWSFDKLIIKGQLGPLKVGGVLTFEINKEEAEFNSTFLMRGQLEVSSEFAALQEFKANFIFGKSINNYTFFYVDALLYWQKGYALGETGLQLNGVGLGFYYNMKKIAGQSSNYSATGCKYGPAAGYMGGMLMAGITDIPTSGKFFQGYAGIDLGFGPGLSLVDIGIFMGAKFGSENSLVSKDGISKNMMKRKAREKPRADADANVDRVKSIKSEYDNATTAQAKAALLKKYGIKDETDLNSKIDKADYDSEKAEREAKTIYRIKAEEEFRAEAQKKLDKFIALEQAKNEAEAIAKAKKTELDTEKAKIDPTKKANTETEIETNSAIATDKSIALNKAFADLTKAKAEKEKLSKALTTKSNDLTAAKVELAEIEKKQNQYKDATSQTENLIIIAAAANEKLAKATDKTDALKNEKIAADNALRDNLAIIQQYDPNEIINQSTTVAKAQKEKDLANLNVANFSTKSEEDELSKRTQESVAASQNLKASQTALAEIKTQEEKVQTLEKENLQANTNANKKGEEFAKTNNTDSIKKEINLAISDGINEANAVLVGKEIIGKDGKRYKLESACNPANSAACNSVLEQMTDADKGLYGGAIANLKGLEEKKDNFANITNSQEYLATIQSINKIRGLKDNPDIVYKTGEQGYIANLLNARSAKNVIDNYEANKKVLLAKADKIRKQVEDDTQATVAAKAEVGNSYTDYVQKEKEVINRIEAIKNAFPDLDINKNPSVNLRIITEEEKGGRGTAQSARAKLALEELIKSEVRIITAESNLNTAESKQLSSEKIMNAPLLSILDSDEKMKTLLSTLAAPVAGLVSESGGLALQNLSLKQINESLLVLETAKSAAAIRLNPNFQKAKYELASKQKLAEQTANQELTFGGRQVKGVDIANELTNKGISLSVFKSEGEYQREITNLSRTTGKTTEQIEIDKAKILAYQYRHEKEELATTEKTLRVEKNQAELDLNLAFVKRTDQAGLLAALQKAQSNINAIESQLKGSISAEASKTATTQLNTAKLQLEGVRQSLDDYEKALVAITRIKQENGSDLLKAQQELADLELRIQNANDADKALFSKEQNKLDERIASLKKSTYDGKYYDKPLLVNVSELDNLKNAVEEDFDDISTQDTFIMIKGYTGYNLEKKEFHLLASGYANIDKGDFTLKGTGNNAGLVGTVDMCIGCTDGFHLWAGSPGQPLSAKITTKPSMGLIAGVEQDIQFYLVGGSLPKDPKLITRNYPEGISKVLKELKAANKISFDPIEDLKRAYRASNGLGIGFAFDQKSTKVNQKGPISYNIGFGVGMDVLLADNVTCMGYGTGFYGTATAIAYAKGKIDFKVSFWGAVVTVPLLEAQLSLALSGGFPKPLYLKGNADFKYSALAGAIKGRIGVDFSMGTQCEVINLFEGGKLNVIAGVTQANFFGGKNFVVNGKYNLGYKFSITLDDVKYDDAGVMLGDYNIKGPGSPSGGLKQTYNHGNNFKAVLVVPETSLEEGKDYELKFTAYIAKIRYVYNNGKDGAGRIYSTAVNKVKYNQKITAKFTHANNNAFKELIWKTDEDPNDSKPAIEAPPKK